MPALDLFGYLASSLVFATFYMKAMTPLRLVAIASNVAFIAYGYLGGMAPILLLHVGLLPLNLWRLGQTLRLVNRLPRSAGDAGLSVKFLRLRKVSARRPTTDAGAVIGPRHADDHGFEAVARQGLAECNGHVPPRMRSRRLRADRGSSLEGSHRSRR